MGTLVAIAGFALAATLTGCGNTDEPTAQETSSETSSPSSEATPTPTESETASDTPTTPEIGDNVPADYKEFCTKLAGFSGDIMSGMSKPDQKFADKYQELADSAPPASKEDWQLLADIVQLSVDAQEDPANADTKKLTELSNKLNAATTNITEDAKKCAGS
ncbi:hypothetical protein [Flindersiella endophytica]